MIELEADIFLDEAGQETEERLTAQRLRGSQNDVLWGAGTPPHLNVILRGPTEKSLQWAQNSYQQH